MRLDLGAVAAATRGRAVGSTDVVARSVSIDTRTLEPGALFFAVRGERDGHEFVAEAAARGAAAAVVDERWAASAPEGGDSAFPVVVVDDTVAALGALARRAREDLAASVVVGVTGSTGKTSVKDLTASALGSVHRTVSSPASYNNELGVPLTVLGAGPETGALVVEMGARGVGQIASLAEIARPTIGVVTTVGAAHIEVFGSEAAVARTKAELLAALPPEGRAVIGFDHAWVDVLAERSSAPVVTVGTSAGADVRVSAVELDAELRPSFVMEGPWGRAETTLEVRGAHQAVNAAIAVTAATSAGVGLDEATAGAARATSAKWRLELVVTPSGARVLDDAYNANPTSMSAALSALAALDVPGRRWAVLGEMAELGERSDEEHARMGELAGRLGVGHVVAVGEAVHPLAAAAAASGCEVAEVPDAASALDVLRAARLGAGDAVLVKASRVAGLDAVAAALAAGEWSMGALDGAGR